ncbi:dual specificity protein phosphatase [Halosimplex aquaticum]|uniref:Dual specificity protein phosphatase n=1 Tax=Halosimplex aquaticum TaxID=3026162 RepID=A0ABD5XT22_9EURY|nr:dual specificity protein phosphatase [Halosimplex aquaticum]
MHGPDWWRDGRAVVRPFGHRHGDPVVRRIGDRDLFLGNVHAADPDRTDRSFDAVLSATREPQPSTTHHRPLVDGPEADWPAFEAAADTACRLLGEGSLLIHCSHGVSRSATLAAVALAIRTGRSFREALSTVQSARPPAQPHPALHELAVVYLAEKSD